MEMWDQNTGVLVMQVNRKKAADTAFRRVPSSSCRIDKGVILLSVWTTVQVRIEKGFTRQHWYLISNNQ